MISEKEFEDVINARFTKPIYSKLKAAHMGVAGLGGLGSHIAFALARCGVGHITLVDFDKVELSNLNRQLYNTTHLGKLKTDVIKDELSKINPYIKIDNINTYVTEENASELFDGCEIVVEAFDKPENKAMLVNTLLEKQSNMCIVSSSGMAGFHDGNLIKTKVLNKRLIMCGDFVNGIENGEGLTAPRVMICAGHAALAAIRIILAERN